jgi:hypothetical protein
LAARAHRTVLHEAAKDSRRATGLFLVLGGLGPLAAFFGVLDAYAIIAISFLGLLACVAPLARVPSGPRTGPSCSGALATLALCGLALLFGLGILVGCLCLEMR